MRSCFQKSKTFSFCFISQRSTVDKLTNTQILMLFIMLVALCLISAIFNEIWTRGHYSNDWYLGIDGNCHTLFSPANNDSIVLKRLRFFFFASDVLSKNFGYNLLTFIILYNNLIPISLQVTLELVRFMQVRYVLLNTYEVVEVGANIAAPFCRQFSLILMLKCTTKSRIRRPWHAHRTSMKSSAWSNTSSLTKPERSRGM